MNRPTCFPPCWAIPATAISTGAPRRKAGFPDRRHRGLGPFVAAQLTGLGTSPEDIDDLLASADVTLGDDILDQIDEIVPPGTDVGTLDQAYLPPAVLNPGLRRRPVGERGAAGLYGRIFSGLLLEGR